MTTPTAASTPTSPPCGSTLYDTPVRDIACAMAYTDDNVDLMAKCCKGADVVSYYDNCGLYCLALGQTSKDLADCLHKQGARWESVFCNDDGEAATATGGGDVMESVGASVVATGGSRTDNHDDDDDDDDDDANNKNNNNNKNDDSDDDDPVPNSPDSAASFSRLPGHVTLLGFAIGGLIFSGSILGTF